MKLKKSKYFALAALVAVVCALLTCGVGRVEASAEETSGYYTYTVSNGEATITRCDSSISGSVTIPSTLGGYPVTKIGDYAFEDCSRLTCITIPVGVTSIGGQAFIYCSSLIGITIPNSVTSIEESAFDYCSRLTTIDVSENNKYYCSLNGVLYNKDKTEIIRFPSGNTAIEYVIPNGVTSIGYSAFSNCSRLTNITIPDSVTSIGEYAFYGCESLASITIPNSVISIGSWAFSYCRDLTNITIPNSVTSIGGQAFIYCSSLTGITIPNSVTSIEESAFDYCSRLTTIDVSENNKYYCSLNGVLYNKDKTEIIRFPSGNTAIEYVIPNGVTSIGYSAFSNCSRLTNITILDSVTSIGEYAFYNCISLTNITIPNSVTSIGYYAFEDCIYLKSAYYLGSQSDWNKVSVGGGNNNLTGAITYHPSHTNENLDGVCDICGYPVSDIAMDETKSVPVSSGKTVYLLFIPEYTCTYTFTSASSSDTCGYLCDEDKNTILSDDDSGTDTNFLVSYSLDAGKKYYLGVRFYSSSKSGTINVKLTHNHSYGSWSTIKAVTCTESGTEQRKCSVCGDTVIETIPALGHNFSSSYTTDKEATCTSSGSKSRHCTRCDEKTDVTTIPATGHNFGYYGSWHTIKAATCTESGTEQRTCPDCGYIETKTISALGHSYSTSYTIDKEATCTSSGSKSRHCTRCDAKTDVRTISKANHTYDSACDEECNVCKAKRKASVDHRYGIWHTIKASTCSERGKEQRTCSYCGKVQTQTIDLLQHAYSSWYTVDRAATCTETGVRSRHCTKCNAKTDVQTIPANGHRYSNFCDTTCNVCGAVRSISHNYGSWKTTKEATCTKTGTRKRVCNYCGYTETQTIPAYGHSYSASYITDKAATCTSGGSKSRHCTRCGAKTDVTTIPAKGHSYGSWSSTKKATCTASGKKQRKCSACGAVETQTLKAFGHKFKTTTTKATITKNGKIVKTCSVCKKTFTTTIPMAKTVKLSKTSYTYNGKSAKPSVTVKDSKGKTLKNGTDYFVSYPSGRKNPGTYKVKITFKGNYNGTKTLSFKISVGKVTGLKQVKQKGYKLAMEWKTVPGATDYEIQKYDSKKKKWVTLGNAKSVKIGFKKTMGTNKYRIRARVKINGKTYYGAYSSTLTTKS